MYICIYMCVYICMYVYIYIYIYIYICIYNQDLALVEDPDFRKFVEMYAKDEKKFFADFAKAYAKLTELGCRNLE